jgi:prophage regulatory protein
MSSRILRLPAAQEFSGYTRSTLYRRIKDNLFPPPVLLSEQSGKRAPMVGWPERELSAINEARIAGKSNEEIRALVQSLVAARTAAA